MAETRGGLKEREDGVCACMFLTWFLLYSTITEKKIERCVLKN